MEHVINALKTTSEYVVNIFEIAGVPVALLAGLFALWQIAINHRRVLEQQKERYKYDLSREIYSEISDRIQEAFQALIQAAATAFNLAMMFSSVEKQWRLLEQTLEKQGYENPLLLAIEPITQKEEVAKTFVKLSYAAGEAVVAVIFTLHKYQVAVPKSAEMDHTIGEQWETCLVQSGKLNNWIVNSFNETDAEKHPDADSPTNPGQLYVDANMAITATLGTLLAKAQEELVGELFQNTKMRNQR